MKLNNLKDLFHQELQDLYSAEIQLLRVLPRLSQVAQHEELRAAFRAHQRQTELHALRLQKIAHKMDRPLSDHHCKGMHRLLEETAEFMDEETDASVLDAALIGAAQRIEHYEMAGYGTARAMASRLGFHEAAALLDDTLDDVKRADARLTGIARTSVNMDAAARQRSAKTTLPVASSRASWWQALGFGSSQ